LDVSGCDQLGDEFWSVIGGLKSLKRLKLSRSGRTAGEWWIDSDQTPWPNLTDLDVSGCYKLGDKFWSTIGRLKSLEVLAVHCRRVNGRWWSDEKQQSAPGVWPNLKHLDMTGCFNLEDVFGLTVGRLKEVESIIFNSCVKLTGDWWDDISDIQHWPKLKRLEIVECLSLVEQFKTRFAMTIINP
jgi:hypothetical protein